MKVSELVRVLLENGWYLYRHGKKHDIYRHPEVETQIPVERHGSKEIAKGTLQAILKRAGLK